MNKQPKSKTRYIAFVAASIDGRISLTHHKPPDWTSKEDWKFFQKSISKAEAVVVGRNTYQTVAERLRKRNTFVLSRRPKTMIRRGTVTFVNPTTVNIRDLLGKYKKIAVLGGGSVYCFMLQNKLLDEIFLTIEPIIFGRGIEMVTGNIQAIQAKLMSVRQLNKRGTLLLHYKINS